MNLEGCIIICLFPSPLLGSPTPWIAGRRWTSSSWNFNHDQQLKQLNPSPSFEETKQLPCISIIIKQVHYLWSEFKKKNTLIQSCWFFSLRSCSCMPVHGINFEVYIREILSLILECMYANVDILSLLNYPYTNINIWVDQSVVI